MPRLTPEQLEAQLHRMLRDQPLRRAPSSLESRVLAEIARREALPWWRRSYTYWPAPAQILFLVVSTALAFAAVTGAVALFSGAVGQFSLARVFDPVVGAIETLRAAGSALADVVRGWIPAIPTNWLYAAALAAGCAYAALVGLGATAYRLLGHPR